jgi:hypothetical protein
MQLLEKTFKITERVKFDVRGSFYNLLESLQFQHSRVSLSEAADFASCPAPVQPHDANRPAAELLVGSSSRGIVLESLFSEGMSDADRRP